MTNRKSLTLAAAVLSIGSFAFAQQAEPAAGARGPAAADQAVPAADQQRGGAAGDQTQQQMIQQLQRIAQDPTTAGDKLFALGSAHEALKCQQISQQVAQKAQSNEVKQLAQRLAQDEQQKLQKLQTVAQSLQIQLPQSLSQKDQQIIAIIASLPADQLEKHYVANVHAESAKDILKLQSCAQLSQNEAVKQFAQQTLPVLQQQHRQAMAAAQTLGVPTAMEAITAGAKIGADSSAPAAPAAPGTGQDTSR